jgi:hypothetical protein
MAMKKKPYGPEELPKYGPALYGGTEPVSFEDFTGNTLPAPRPKAPKVTEPVIEETPMPSITVTTDEPEPTVEALEREKLKRYLDKTRTSHEVGKIAGIFSPSVKLRDYQKDIEGRAALEAEIEGPTREPASLKASRDPNSMYTKFRRYELKSQLLAQKATAERHGLSDFSPMADEILRNLDSMTGADIDRVLGRDTGGKSASRKPQGMFEDLDDYEKLEHRRLQEARLAGKESRLADQFPRAMKAKYQGWLNSHPLVKKSDEAIAGADVLDRLLDDAFTKGGQSVAAIGPKMAKALGEVGVLTERDVTAYVQNPKLAASVAGTFKRMAVGKLIQEDYQNMKRLTGILRQAAEAQQRKGGGRIASQYAETMGVDEEAASQAVNPSKVGTPTKGGGLSPKQKKRLEQLRAKKAQGTLK